MVISSKTKLLNNHLAFCNTPDLNSKFIDFDERVFNENEIMFHKCKKQKHMKCVSMWYMMLLRVI